MRKISFIAFLLFISLSVVKAGEKPTDRIEDYLVLKIKNGDLLTTSNGYLISSFERDRAILRDIEPEVKRKEEYFVSVKTTYYYIEYQLFLMETGDAIVAMLENIKGKKVFRFVKYSQEINGFQPTSFQDLCPQWKELIGDDPDRTAEKLNEYRFSFNKNGLSQVGKKDPTLRWDGSKFVATEELLAYAKRSIDRSISSSKKKKK